MIQDNSLETLTLPSNIHFFRNHVHFSHLIHALYWPLYKLFVVTPYRKVCWRHLTNPIIFAGTFKVSQVIERGGGLSRDLGKHSDRVFS